jgi:hypothetical protein
MPALTAEEDAKINQLITDYQLSKSPAKNNETRRKEFMSECSNRSLLNPEELSKIEQIDENLRQLVPIDKWEEWSIKTSIRSITWDSMSNISEKQESLNQSKELTSLAGPKAKLKKMKPGDKYLKERAEERDLKKQLTDVNNKLLNLQQKQREAGSQMTPEEKKVIFNY